MCEYSILGKKTICACVHMHSQTLKKNLEEQEEINHSEKKFLNVFPGMI